MEMVLWFPQLQPDPVQSHYMTTSLGLQCFKRNYANVYSFRWWWCSWPFFNVLAGAMHLILPMERRVFRPSIVHTLKLALSNTKWLNDFSFKTGFTLSIHERHSKRNKNPCLQDSRSKSPIGKEWDIVK